MIKQPQQMNATLFWQHSIPKPADRPTGQEVVHVGEPPAPDKPQAVFAGLRDLSLRRCQPRVVFWKHQFVHNLQPVQQLQRAAAAAAQQRVPTVKGDRVQAGNAFTPLPKRVGG